MKKELVGVFVLVILCQAVVALDYELRTEGTPRVGEQFKIDVYAKSAQEVRYLQGNFIFNWDPNYLDFVSVVPSPDFPWVTTIFAPSSFQNYPDGTRSGINQINFDIEDGDSLYWLMAGYPATPQEELPIVNSNGYKLFSVWFEPKIEGSTVFKIPKTLLVPAEPECQQPGTNCVNYFTSTSNCLPLNTCPLGTTNQLTLQISSAPAQPQGPICGNGIIESGEVCDSLFVNGVGCTEQGFDYGTIKCSSNCLSFDTSSCLNYQKDLISLELSSNKESAAVGEEFEVTVEYKSDVQVQITASDFVLKWDPSKAEFVSFTPSSSNLWLLQALITKQGAGVNNNPQSNEGSLAEGAVELSQAANIGSYPKSTPEGLHSGTFKFKSKTNSEIEVKAVESYNFPSTIDASVYPPKTCNAGEDCRFEVESIIYAYCDRNNAANNIPFCLGNRGNVKINTEQNSDSSVQNTDSQETDYESERSEERDERIGEEQEERVNSDARMNSNQNIVQDILGKETKEEKGSLEKDSGWISLIEFLSRIRGFIYEKIGRS